MGFLGDLWDGVKEVASDVWEFGSDVVETGWDFVTDSAKTVWDVGTNFVGGAWDFTVDAGKLLYSFVGEESVSDAWDRLTDDFVENGANLFNDFIEDEESKWINFGANELDTWEFLLPDDISDMSKLIKCLHAAGLDDEVVESAVTEIANDNWNINTTNIVAEILSNPEIAAELDADKLEAILNNLEKEKFSDDMQENIDMVVKNKDVAIELYNYLTEMGMDNRSAMLAAKELITAPDIKTGAIKAIDIVAASGLIKNMNGTFFQDFTEIASKLDIGDYGNSFIEFAQKNSKAIDAINNLLIAHGIDDQTLIQIGNEYLRTEDMNALAEYIFQNEKVQDVLTQYRANFEELAAEQGIPIKDEEMCVNSNGLTNKEMLILSNFEYTNFFRRFFMVIEAYDV